MHAGIIRRTRVAAAVGGVALALSGGQALGAAFALQENSGSGLGNAFAGGAAAAEDASTIWSNPAGMARLVSPEVAAAVHFVTPTFKFRDEGSLPANFQTLGGTGGDAGSLNIIPNLYVSAPINRQFSVGLGLNAPFGLVTEYDDSWLGRFQAVKSDIMTINVNPAVSWRVNDAFAVGVGVNWQRVDAELTQKINYSGALAQAALDPRSGLPAALVPQVLAAIPPGLESKAKVEGDDNAWGWNIGFLWDVTPQTRVGGQYRSSIKYRVSANVSFENPGLPTLPASIAPVMGALAAGVNGGALFDGGVDADIELPDVANLSVFHRLNDRWDLMADLQFTRWSTFKELRFIRTTGALLSLTPENFDDAWRVSAGATYRWNEAWSFRGGLAWDQTPTSTADRTPRLPDESRVWFSAGAQYRFSKNLKLDGGFTYIVIDNADINQSAPLSGGTPANGLIKGHYDSSVTIFSAQLTYTF